MIFDFIATYLPAGGKNEKCAPQPVSINRDHVLWIKTGNGMTIIYLTDGSWIGVQESQEKVSSILNTVSR